eukprot:6013461-Amphidinium_carterae.1
MSAFCCKECSSEKCSTLNKTCSKDTMISFCCKHCSRGAEPFYRHGLAFMAAHLAFNSTAEQQSPPLVPAFPGDSLRAVSQT